MNNAEKALLACVEYAKAKADVARLSKEIGEALEGCYSAFAQGRTHWENLHKYESHLSRAFAYEVGEREYGEPGRIYLTAEEQAEVLAECPHCMAAYKAVQARKEAKKRLGIAKRRIGIIGKTAV
jgi:hypothetical protein